ncbi:hypothetical protein BST97_12270 [Nonlabens spongiae]|uniref:Mannosyltransferase n=1 Tax=Nonlabens spongiae TaxID=331648 RepID=A0A1W6MM75_9FLAO|nr:glycosyltransferase 87 family protein [Nonlabens spongiae]ARN78704.1 hypothetical protein BST97_12270 [Nonlabens spongiae]
MSSKSSNILGLVSIASVFLYAFFVSLSRKQFTLTALTYTILFVLLGIIYEVYRQHEKKGLSLFDKLAISKWQWSGGITALFLIGIALRGVFLFETPTLSQDFFRFIWDGHQLLNGFNPYTILPDEVINGDVSHIPHANYLYDNMGTLSSGNYTNYPPLNQFFFTVAAAIGGDNLLATVVSMRLIIIAADVMVFFYGVRLLQMLGRPAFLIMLYYLNPFTIIELTGNLHWEGVMASFLLLSIYFLFRQDRVKSAWMMGNGILLKLMPVITLPLLIRSLPWRKLVWYYLYISFVVICGFFPFISEELVNKYGSSVGLWFGKFEFNASIYYIVRAVGFEITGYNIIETAGKILPIITFLVVWLMALVRKNQYPEILLESIVFSFFTYLLLSTTVHPWYLTIPLLFSIFTRFRFMVLWSLLVFLSYFAYSQDDFKENMWLIAVQYLSVVSYLVYEFYFSSQKKSFKPLPSSNDLKLK